MLKIVSKYRYIFREFPTFCAISYSDILTGMHIAR